MKTDSNEKWIVCRVCLNNPNEGEDLLQDIFSQNASTRLDQMLYICAGIPVSIDDNFPDKMCSKCVLCLRMAYKFRMTCQRSHQQIIDMLAREAASSNSRQEAVQVDDLLEENVVKVWEEHTNQLEAQVKLEDEEGRQQQLQHLMVSFVEEEAEAGVVEDEGVDSIVYEASVVEEDEQQVVVFDEDQTVIEEAQEMESYAEVAEEYEEVEVLAQESGAQTPAPPQPPTLTRRGIPRVVYTDDLADNDITHDILSSDEDTASYLMEQTRTKAKRLVRPEEHTGQPTTNKTLGRKPKSKQTNYICDVCGNIYPTQARLTEHMKFHSGIKPHECEICGRGFVQNQQLVRHMNTHTGNRPYKCNYCPAAFADRSTKTKHHRIHTKERPYECDVCFRTFTYSDNLKFHKMIHTGEKPHVCDLCGKGFVKAYKMRLHRVTHEKRRNWKPSGDVEMELTAPAASSSSLQSTVQCIKDEMPEFMNG